MTDTDDEERIRTGPHSTVRRSVAEAMGLKPWVADQDGADAAAGYENRCSTLLVQANPHRNPIDVASKSEIAVSGQRRAGKQPLRAGPGPDRVRYHGGK